MIGVWIFLIIVVLIMIWYFSSRIKNQSSPFSLNESDRLKYERQEREKSKSHISELIDKERDVLIREIKKLSKENEDVRHENNELRNQLNLLDKSYSLLERNQKKLDWEEDYKEHDFVEKLRKSNAKTKESS